MARFVLRLPPPLHRHLTARAAAHGLSLNEYCIRMLSGPEPRTIDYAGALRLRTHAEAVAGGKLVGLVVHGSWARGEARTSSDVDVLVVVERRLALTRTLYRAWDREPLDWDGRPIDAHFVHLPEDAGGAGGLWCETAIDGSVVADTDGRVERALAAIRRAIAEGRLVRKQTHGQPYWTAA